MNQLNQRLNNIILNSNIDFYEEYTENLLYKKYTNINIVKDIQMIWNEIPHKSRVAIFGAGNHTMKLFEIVERKEKNIVCIIDKLKPNGNIYEYPIVNSNELMKYNVDVIVISTLGYAEEIKNELFKLNIKCEIIDIYEKLKIKNYNCKEPFYYQKNYEIYYKIHYIKNIYNKSNDEKLLCNLIFKYLDIRDFYNADKWIKEYIKKEYCQYKLFRDLLAKLQAFQEDIRLKIEKRTNRNGLILLIDALRYKDVFENKNMPLLLKRANKGISCNNAYTHVPYTSMSIASILSGKKLLDNELFNINLSLDKCGIIHKIKEINTEFNYYGNQVQFFSSNNIIESKYNCISEMLWNYICNIYDNYIKNNLSFIHVMEAHPPYIVGNHNNEICCFGDFTREKINNIYDEYIQHNEALKYVDEQLEYYFNYISKDTSIIVCSDHGHIIEYDQTTKNKQLSNEDMIHIPYIILGKNIKPTIEKRLISHLDTGEIMFNLLNGKNPLLDITYRNSVEINRDFTYSKNDIDKLQKLNLQHLGKAFKCFRTNSEKYILYYDMKEKFYVLPDEETNLICDEEYQKRIKEIKKEINLTFPDFKGARFEYAKEVFKI